MSRPDAADRSVCPGRSLQNAGDRSSPWSESRYIEVWSVVRRHAGSMAARFPEILPERQNESHERCVQGQVADRRAHCRPRCSLCTRPVVIQLRPARQRAHLQGRNPGYRSVGRCKCGDVGVAVGHGAVPWDQRSRRSSEGRGQRPEAFRCLRHEPQDARCSTSHRSLAARDPRGRRELSKVR